MNWIKLSFVLAKRDLINRFKWSHIGSLWPLVSFAIYSLAVSIVYSKVFNLDLKNYLPYITSGIAAWTFVQAFLSEGVNLYFTFKGLIVNVKIPYWVYHLALAIKVSLLLGLQIPVILIVKAIFGQDFFPGILFLPISLIFIGLIGITTSRILAIIGAIWRDFAHLIPSVITIFTLITPILFPITLLEKAKWLYEFNPFFYLVSVVRDPIAGTIPIENHLVICLIMLLFSLLLAEYLERKVIRKIIPLL